MRALNGFNGNTLGMVFLLAIAASGCIPEGSLKVSQADIPQNNGNGGGTNPTPFGSPSPTPAPTGTPTITPTATPTATPTPTPTATPTPTPTPDPCAGGSLDPHLLVKSVVGRPGTTVTASLSGTTIHQSMVFKNQAGMTVKTSTIGSGGEVVLPSKAGQYTVELVDQCATVKVSYGVATVNDTYTGFSSNSAHSISYTQNQFRFWPDANLALADYDLDGIDDVAFGSGNNGVNGSVLNPGVHLYRYDVMQGKMVFSSTVPETNVIEGLKFADLNEDGYPDLVWGSHTAEKLKIAYGGSSGFGTPVALNLPTSPTTGTKYIYDVEIADLDHDGHTDIVAAGGILQGGASWVAADLFIFKGDGHGAFTANVVEKTGSGNLATSVSIADADDDGRLDLYTYFGSTALLYRLIQKPDGTFSFGTLNTDYYITSPAHGNNGFDQIRVGYINSDTRPDVIASMVNGPDGYFVSNMADMTLSASSVPSPADQLGARSQIADLNGDGVMEVYFPLKNRALYANKPGILVKNATNITASVTVSSANTIVGSTTLGGWSNNSMLFGDFNGDGKIDIFTSLGDNKVIDMIYGN